MTDFIPLADTAHSYAGNTNTGAESHDGSEATYLGSVLSQSHSFQSGASFGFNTVAWSEHIFVAPRTVKEVKFKVYLTGSVSGPSDRAAQINYAVQYRLNGVWINFTGGTGTSRRTDDGSVTLDPGLITLAQTIQNCEGVRVQVDCGGSFHNESGSNSGDVRIYEIQAYGELGGFAAVI